MDIDAVQVRDYFEGERGGDYGALGDYAAFDFGPEFG